MVLSAQRVTLILGEEHAEILFRNAETGSCHSGGV